MKRIPAIAAVAVFSTLLSCPQASAQFSSSKVENRKYVFTLKTGWIGAVCNAYQQGFLPDWYLRENLEMIGDLPSEKMTEKGKQALFELIINDNPDDLPLNTPKCSKAIKEWLKKSGS